MRRPHVEHRAITFDLLYLDEDRTHLEFESRRQHLQELTDTCPDRHYIALIQQAAVQNLEEFSRRFDSWQESGFEGMVAKRPNAVYEANLETKNLIKIKLKDTVDALIVGYSDAPRSYLAALWDEELNEYVPFSWISPQKDLLADLVEQVIVLDLPSITAGGRATQVRLRPSLVVEIGGDKIFSTSNFPCGQHQTGQGWSLNAATLVDIRYDKSPADVTTVSQFLEIPPMAGYPKPKLIDNE